MTAVAPTLKKAVPARGKHVAEQGLRGWGMITAPLRPLPDFLIVGTKRGGTTSMWNYLLAHPGVLPMFPGAKNLKSPHFFYWHYDRGVNWYRSHFASAPVRSIAERRLGGPVRTGEASPNYLYDPRVPARVRELMPETKIIVMLRDPVERAYSHYKERVRAGVEHLSLEDALDAEPDRLAGEAERMDADRTYYSRPYDYYAYRDRGVYEPQVRRWLASFPPESLLFIRSEDFYADPAAVYGEVTNFLGLSQHPLRSAKKFNYMPAASMPASAREELTRFYAPHNERLEALLGRRFGWSA